MLTPANAGKRALVARLFAYPEDHPRACGEKDDAVAYAAVDIGSPQRLRGKVAIALYETI